VWVRRRYPKGSSGPIHVRDLDDRLDPPFLARVFDDPARGFVVLAIMLGQPFLGAQDGDADLVDVGIGRMHQDVEVACLVGGLHDVKPSPTASQSPAPVSPELPERRAPVRLRLSATAPENPPAPSGCGYGVGGISPGAPRTQGARRVASRHTTGACDS